MSQTITLAIQGGSLELETTHADVVLEPAQGSDRTWVGSLPPVRVVDARGTLEGWEVRWTVDGVKVDGTVQNGGRTQVSPATPTVVYGDSYGIASGDPATASHRGRVLFSADREAGGGTYEAGGTVSLRLPPHVDADEVSVDLAFSIS
jgi:hypothetical protein